ncbi:MAG: site-specific DNA-methyltransferase [Ignavibacteriae bacterium]|nr:site-specific DNA-methyltransferase [Ignavibacteriota bacterium]
MKYEIDSGNHGIVFENLIEYISHEAVKQKEPIKPVFKTDDFCLYNEDCLKVMAKFPDNYIDMIFADPPYMLSNNGFTCYAGRMVSVNKGDWDKSNGFEEDLKFNEAWISECKRILKPEGSIWISGTYHSIYQCGFLLQKLNFHVLNDITWYKPNAAPNLSRTVFAASHENLIWARKDKKARHIFNYDFMKNGNFKEDIFKNDNRQMRSVWAINTPKPDEKFFGKHPTQKPVDLLKRIIISSTNENAIILDPFNGGGTTGIASKIIGKRKYIGIEINKEYIDLTLKRYNQLINHSKSFF